MMLSSTRPNGCRWEFGVLGSLEARCGGRPVDLGGHKQRAVLAALLIDANQVVAVDQLLYRLWGDEPPLGAVSTLQGYVHHLRLVLEPERLARASAQVLVTQRPGYVLQLEPSDVDAVRFEALAVTGRRHLSDGDHGLARAHLTDALALWRGPALAEFGSEPFAENERARLHELRLLAREERIEADLGLGHHTEAVVELEALVRDYPLRERIWSLLMLALYRSGRQADALRSYHQARQNLRENLGLEPSPALRRLERDILSQAPELDWSPGLPRGSHEIAVRAVTFPVSGVTLPGTEPDVGAGSTPFVGRDHYLAQLRRALARCADAGSGVVLVGGSVGIGKTRLVQELRRHARAAEINVAWGRCWDGSTLAAFWPWTQVARQLVACVEAESPGAVWDWGVEAIASIVPEAVVRRPPISALEEHVPDPFAVYDAVVRFLGRVAARSPVVVIIEDLQWADLASVELLRFLADNLPQPGLLVVATYRDDEVVEGGALARNLPPLAREPTVETLTLPGMSPREVDALVAAVTGSRPEPDGAVDLHGRTGGNPLFVVELAPMMGRHPARRHDFDAPLPSRVRDVILRRLAKASDATRSLLRIAAVIGQEFALGVLAKVADVDFDHAMELVEEALAIAVVVECPETVGSYRFSPPLVQQTLYFELSALRRVRVQAQVAAVVTAPWGNSETPSRNGSAGGGDDRPVAAPTPVAR